MQDPDDRPDDVPASPPSEVTSGKLLRNTVVNGGANVVGAAITAILTPFLLHHLGGAEYGIWLLALGLTFSSGYLALADLGLTETTVKFIAEARAAGSIQTVNDVASTTVAAFTALGAVVGAVMAVLAPLLVHVFSVAPALEGDARKVFALMALEIVLELPVAGLRAVIEGAQDYARLRGIDVLGRVLWGVLVVVLVRGGHGVVALALLALAIAAVRAAVTVVMAHRVQPGLQLRPRFVSRRVARTIGSYGSYVGGLRFLSVIYAQMDRAIIGAVVSVAAVASYEIAFRIQSIATLVLTMASSAVVPAAAYNAARAEQNKQRELYLRGTKYAIAISAPLIVAAILYAEPLIVAWVGPGYESMVSSTRLFLVFPIFAAANQVGVSMLIGQGGVRAVLLLQSIAVGINLVLSIVLSHSMGINGVIVGTLVGGLVTWGPYVRLLQRTFGVTLGAWLRRCVLPSVPGTAVQVVVGIVSLHWARDLERLWAVGLACAVSAGISMIAFAVAGLDGRERRHLVGRFLGAPPAADE